MVQLKNETELLAEIRALVASSCKPMKSSVRGTLRFHELGFHGDTGPRHSSPYWVLQAQLGTLEKLEQYFGEDRRLASAEILAVARNLFENHIWLRLFNLNLDYGLVFYAQLLRQNEQDLAGLISKLESEAELFERYEKIDMENLDRSYEPIASGHATEQEIEAARQSHNELTAELDAKARREFALYAAAAQFNGYGYQRHLLLRKIIPKHRQTLTMIQSHRDQFNEQRDSLLPSDLGFLAKHPSKWNWKEMATKVAMERQYEFLYAYTSRLLHSTPMNLITEKALLDSERIIMLEYAFVTCHDLLDAISSFTFPGKINALFVDLDND